MLSIPAFINAVNCFKGRSYVEEVTGLINFIQSSMCKHSHVVMPH